ncbi:TetR/AcrR family transcriptional regulator [Mycobacterium sp. GA-2829]|uniref:TetR/AcrR family transcriptional regulator n=1 Tax=Mycobacterium sp. GA-2829 TaxID=1772283 RepID=UPI00073FD5E1|nr:TetR/AcrR family transcriptional regulator [Mycobacterium sp. GA-2829]KUI35517.1 TetR family transcriptional regulator [Mycobacterium sp. GA-2829]
MTSARERILDAYEDLLAVEGERYATLEAVAAKAGVSKGGLLYHFPAKDQLAAALCERFVALAAEDTDRMRTDPEGPARYYVRSSHYAGTPLDRALMAVSRLQQSGDERAREVIESASEQWLGILQEALGSREAARAVKLIGDGLYYHALHSALGGRPETARTDEGLLRVVDRITDVPDAE